MGTIKLGDNVLLKEMIGFDTVWTVTVLEGSKATCVSYDETHGYQTITVDVTLLKLN